MLKSLNLIKEVRESNFKVLKEKENKWLTYLFFTHEKKINIERIESIKDIDNNCVLNNVENTLKILNLTNCDTYVKNIVEEVLIWSEVSKCGLKHQRLIWEKEHINLFIHNFGSAEIYAKEKGLNETNIYEMKNNYIVYVLIKTHGLIGQYIRGEVNLAENKEITNLLNLNLIDKTTLRSILYVLNKSIILDVSKRLWKNIKDNVLQIIDFIIEDNYENEYSLEEKLKKLRKKAILNGEDTSSYNKLLENKEIKDIMNFLFSRTYLWYVESALSEFSFEEFIKMFLICYVNCNPLSITNISFETLMYDIYYDYKDKKAINFYKKRIIEKYLSEISIDEILKAQIKNNEHVNYKIINMNNATIGLTFEFSSAGKKLIEFCQEAEKSSIYSKGILLLYDLFGFRKDEYDRFNNENEYLETMNSTIEYKKIISDYIVGDKIIDVGPGGGALMDIITKDHPNSKVLGLDISINAVEELKKKKIKENKCWDVLLGNILDISSKRDNIKNHFKAKEDDCVSTFIFSSIIHEIFSYTNFNDKKFNYDSIKLALKNSFNLLEKGGRIIIRDGIMTEPKNQYRIIRFKNKEDISILKTYCKEFKGREINFELLDDCSVKMKINDTMEFLYTYTWGNESFAHEVQEQFGYFTPSEFKTFIKDNLGENANIIEFKHYLQDGYEKHLLEKIELYDDEYNIARLPDSTCFIVIEKK